MYLLNKSRQPFFIFLFALCIIALSHASEKQVSQTQEEIVVEIPLLPDGAKPLILIKIPAGTFNMGSPEGEEGRDPDEGPVHQVEISRDFYFGKYEVTQAQWETLMENNPSTEKGPNLPVNRVSWNDCQIFLQKLEEATGKKGFRLPTEAEREYAARAGTTQASYLGDHVEDEVWEDHAWFRNNSEGELHPVGELQPNPWGLFDLFGNVWEWCQDGYTTYPDEKQVDPVRDGEEKVHRGASWMARPQYLRSADRGKFAPGERRNTGGLRVAYSE